MQQGKASWTISVDGVGPTFKAFVHSYSEQIKTIKCEHFFSIKWMTDELIKVIS